MVFNDGWSINSGKLGYTRPIGGSSFMKKGGGGPEIKGEAHLEGRRPEGGMVRQGVPFQSKMKCP